MHSFVGMGLITLQWVAFGYSLAFGPDHGGVIGGLSFAFLRGVGWTAPRYDESPHRCSWPIR